MKSALCSLLGVFLTFPRIHLMSLQVSLSAIHTCILLRNSIGLMTLFPCPPLLSLRSLLSTALTLTDPPLSLSPAGQFQPGHMTTEFRPQGSRCGRRANGNAEVIWVELIALFYSPAEQCKPPPSLSDSLYLSLVGFFQNQQKCTDGQRLQTWMHGQIKLSCFVVKAC